MKKNFIKISVKSLTNFKPHIINNFKNLNFKKNNRNRLYCRNFFIYLLLMKFKNLNFFEKVSIFIKKQKKNTYTLLRAPYRHKLSRHQLFFQRYELNFSIFINIKLINTNNNKNIVNIIKYLKNSNKLFESNLIYLNKISLIFNISYKNLFLIKFYNNK